MSGEHRDRVRLEGTRPGATDELVLICAATRTRRKREAARARSLASKVDGRDLARELAARRLLPTLGPRVLELAGPAADADFAAEVVAAQESACRQDALLGGVTDLALDSLAAAGIVATALKGVRLGEELYGGPGRRLSSDIDLLVDAERLHDAVAVVRGLGYLAPEDPLDRRGLPRLHLTLLHGSGQLPAIELHWRIHWYEELFACERLLPDPSVSDWQPEPVDQFLALLAYYARDGFCGPRLLTDLGAWWDRRGESVGATDFQARLREYPALAPTFLAGAIAAERLAGLETAPLLAGGPRPGRRVGLAARLARPLARSSATQIYAEMALVDGLLTVREGLGDYRSRQFGRSNDHCFRTLGRIGFALARAAASPGSGVAEVSR